MSGFAGNRNCRLGMGEHRLDAVDVVIVGAGFGGASFAWQQAARPHFEGRLPPTLRLSRSRSQEMTMPSLRTIRRDETPTSITNFPGSTRHSFVSTLQLCEGMARKIDRHTPGLGGSKMHLSKTLKLSDRSLN